MQPSHRLNSQNLVVKPREIEASVPLNKLILNTFLLLISSGIKGVLLLLKKNVLEKSK